MIEHAPTNTLIISDYAANIRRIIRILNILDVEGFQEQIAVVPLQFASASDVARKINDIFPTGGAAAASASAARRRTSSSGSAANQSVIQKVVADDRTNSLIILGSERGIQQVKAFIAQIDVSIDGGEGGIYVYPLQNVKADELSQTLASLTSGQKKGTGTAATPRGSRATNDAAPAPLPGASGPSAASLFDGEVKITADTTTNSLVVQASRRDFEVLKGIIGQLDIRRRQVFIESVILEASVSGGSSFGTQVSGPIAKTSALGRSKGEGRSDDSSESPFVLGMGNLQNDENPLSVLSGLLGSSAITGLALGFRSGGTVAVPITGKDGEKTTVNVPLLSAIVKLAANNSKLNVLSTPHILATANQPATISIGQEVPQLSARQPTESGQVTESYTPVKIATELSITPQINAGDYLTLEIDQKVNDAGEMNKAGQISKITREAKTTAIVKDGQTIVIGGIMRERKVTSESKVPFLGDIPVLGWLFKSRYNNNEKVNLLLFITPHIIRDTGDMNDIFFQKLKEREGFMFGNSMKESKKIPVSGYTKEQLQMLDEDYVKSFQLRQRNGAEGTAPLSAPQPEMKPIVPGPMQPLESSPGAEPSSAPSPNLQPALPSDLPTIPVAPRSVEEPLETEDTLPKKREEFVIPVPPSSEPAPLAPLPEPEAIPAPSAPRIEAPVDAPVQPEAPTPAPAPSAPREGDLPPLDDLLEEDTGTEGSIEGETEVL